MMGSNRWLDLVFNNGNATFETIDAYFESFTLAMTNQYHMTFGGSYFDPNAHDNLLNALVPGQVHGIVWQSNVCNQMQWEWLLLPALILLATAILLVWTVAKSWECRREQPVWKDNVLPAVIYRERSKEEGDSSFGGKTLTEGLG
jgi:hypothetical protein